MVAYNDLPWPNQLNIEADAATKDFLESPPPELCPTSSPSHFEGDPVLVSVAGLRVTKHLCKTLTNAFTENKMIPYLLQRNQWTRTEFDKVNWDAIRSAQGREMQHFDMRMIKMMNDWANVGKQKHKIVEGSQPLEDPTTVGKCPCCLNYETPSHIWQCTSAEMREATGLELRKFQSFMAPVKTSLLLLWCLLTGLRPVVHFFGLQVPNIDVPDTDAHGKSIHGAVRDQQDVGWTNALKGKLAMEWQHAQELYYMEWYAGNKTHNGRRWAVRAVRGLWGLYDGLWKVCYDVLH